MALSPDEIHEAATELFRDGEKVSTVTVYRKLGRGSLTTIGKYLKEWRPPEGEGDTSAEETIPAEFEEAFTRFSRQLWERVRVTTERRISAVRREQEDDVKRFKGDAEEAAQLADQLQAVLERERKERTTEKASWAKEREAFQDEIRHVREEFSVTVKLHVEANERIERLEEELTQERERRSRAEEERGAFRERAAALELRVQRAENERETFAGHAALRAEESHEARAELKAAVAEVQELRAVKKGLEDLVRETQEKASREAQRAARLEGEVATLKGLLAEGAGKPKYTRR
jgi:chromosome segregation ATPase